jgi:uncharacterized NAD(P)/FAD-binding protein YdhS
LTRIVIVGGGASGVLLASHLLRDSRAGLVVKIVEQREELGAGVAYSTKDPDHLLNVRAANMSAFADEPEHFFLWLRKRVPWTGTAVPEASSFAPRRLYREYLSSLLAPHFLEGRLRVIQAEAVAISEGSHAVTVHFRNGSSCVGERVILATGNEGPKLPPATWRYDGWNSSAVPAIAADAPVVIVGTGLTMVDWVLTLLHAGHSGPITAVSHRGLIPHEHRTTEAVRIDASSIPFGASLGQTMLWLKRRADLAEAGEGDWRSVIDGLRPYTQRLWQQLPIDEKRRFLRHARPWWDQHRHRIAPDAAHKLETARESGQFRIIAGRVLGFEDRGEGADVRIALRGTHREERIFAEAVFECRGRAGNVETTENPLLRSLLASGQARPDPLRLGLDVTEDCALIPRDGRISDSVGAIGPVTSGVFWEITAVPDIRVQAARLAQKILAAHPNAAHV